MVQGPPSDEMRIGGRPQDCEGDGLDPSVRRSSPCERANRIQLTMSGARCFFHVSLDTWNKAARRALVGQLCEVSETMRTPSRIKLARNRVDISNNELARHWRKYFGATMEKIEAAIAKVGDNPETVQKELRAQERCNT